MGTMLPIDAIDDRPIGTVLLAMGSKCKSIPK